MLLQFLQQGDSASGSYQLPLHRRIVRIWYDTHDQKLIHSRIDQSLPIEVKARQAFDLRNLYRTQARELMGDQLVGRAKLDRNDPNKEWEQLIVRKMNKYNLTREEAIEDIYRSATTPNKEINEKFGLK